MKFVDQERSIIVFRNGITHDGVELSGAPNDLQRLIRRAGAALEVENPQRLFNSRGMEITAIGDLGREVFFFVSDGEDFIAPRRRLLGQHEMDTSDELAEESKHFSIMERKGIGSLPQEYQEHLRGILQENEHVLWAEVPPRFPKLIKFSSIALSIIVVSIVLASLIGEKWVWLFIGLSSFMVLLVLAFEYGRFLHQYYAISSERALVLHKGLNVPGFISTIFPFTKPGMEYYWLYEVVKFNLRIVKEFSFTHLLINNYPYFSFEFIDEAPTVHDLLASRIIDPIYSLKSRTRSTNSRGD